MSKKAYREIDEAELDGLIERVQTAVEHELSLSLDDMRLLLEILFSFAHLHERLSENAITVQKLRKLAGIVNASEKLRDVLPDAAKAKVSKQRTKKTRPPKPTPEQLIHERCTHRLEGLAKGDRCPECERGTLYKYAPASFIRLSGQSPLQRTQHLLERLRCNLCGAYFTAEVDEAVREDGEPSQQYGYSARAMIAIHKYFAGLPLYRQYTLGQLLGVSLSASSGFDQCEHVANAGQAVMRCLIAQAANAAHYYLDDTKNRILNQSTAEKPDRRSGKLKTRSGVYTSGVIATLAEGHQAVLFQTTIGHAGEWIDEILAPRSSQAPPPILMSDALNHNRPSVIKEYELSLCNAHGRREFVDLAEHAPDQIAWVLQEYGKIWDHEAHCRERQLSRAERLAYHQEKSLPMMEAIKAWADKQLDSGAVEAHSALGKAMAYYRRHYRGLTAFCRIEGAQLDNNVLETTLKLIIRHRKNALFFKTLTGAAVADVLTSLIATCDKAGVNPFDYLVALQRYTDLVKRRPEHWLPWCYQETIAAIQAQKAA